VVPLGWVGLHYWRSASADRPEFRTAAVTRGDIILPVGATGQVEPMEVIDVGAQIPGMVKMFGPDPNRPGKTIDYDSRVRKGSLLAQLDDAPHQCELTKSEANLRLAESELSRCQARLKQARSAYARAERLRDTNAESDYESAVAAYDVAKAETDVAGARLEQAKAAKKLAETNLGYTRICSPVDGVIIDRRVNVGQTVVAGLNAPSLFLLAKDLSRMLVWAAVNEADIGNIHLGQPATFKVDAYRDQEFSGTVSQIRLNASMAQNVVTYGVVVEVDNRDERLLPYMTAKLKFEVARSTNVLRVPNQALRWQPTLSQVTPELRQKFQAAGKVTTPDDSDATDDEDQQRIDLDATALWVVGPDGFVRPIEVKTGLSDGINTEIKEGKIEADMQVVIRAVREAQPDFVSSFISQVVPSAKR